MINEDLLFTRADSSDFMMSNKPVLLLAHGAGAPMDSEFMNRISIQLSEKGVIVIRFEFPYMRERRSKGRKKPPDNMQILLTSFYDTLESISHLINKRRSLFIGGKSMGGRVATMLLSCEPHDHLLPAKSRAIVARVKGCVCLGFPFHPAAKPEKAEKRVRHLAHVKQPVLILQGERDKLGSRDFVQGYPNFLGNGVMVKFIEDGSHDFVPRKRSSVTLAYNEKKVVEEVSKFIITCS